MATNLRVGGTYGYQPYREVEPVPPYPRVNQQQSRDEYPHQQKSQRTDKEETARRRFNAMRRLIDKLKNSQRIVRVDYFTAEKELLDQGLTILDQKFGELLKVLGFAPGAVDSLVDQLRENSPASVIEPGPSLKKEDNFLPEFIPGLTEYHLNSKQLDIFSADCPEKIRLSIESDGYFFFEQNHIRIDFRPGNLMGQLTLNVSILVAAGETDEEGRKVLLYQRTQQSYGLYADKQINLSI